jgi:hypothetical protein
MAPDDATVAHSMAIEITRKSTLSVEFFIRVPPVKLDGQQDADWDYYPAWVDIHGDIDDTEARQ